MVAIRADADRPLLHRHTAVKRCCVVRAEGEDIIEWVCHYRCDVDRDVTQVVRCFHATDSAGKRVHRNACNCYLLADFIVRDGRQNQRALCAYVGGLVAVGDGDRARAYHKVEVDGILAVRHHVETVGDALGTAIVVPS